MKDINCQLIMSSELSASCVDCQLKDSRTNESIAILKPFVATDEIDDAHNAHPASRRKQALSISSAPDKPLSSLTNFPERLLNNVLGINRHETTEAQSSRRRYSRVILFKLKYTSIYNIIFSAFLISPARSVTVVSKEDKQAICFAVLRSGG